MLETNKEVDKMDEERKEVIFDIVKVVVFFSIGWIIGSFI